MNEMFVVRASIGAFAAVCQWYVFSCTRMYLFGKREPVSWKAAYGLLGIIALLNLLAVKIEFDPTLLPRDLAARKMAAIGIFCYLGLTVILSLWFLMISLLSYALSLGDTLLSAMIARKEEASATASSGTSSAASRGKVDSTFAGSCLEHPSSCVRSGPAMNRRAFLQWSALTGLTGAAVLAMEGLTQAYQQPIVEEFDFCHPMLAGLAKSLTLLHITDFHYGTFMGARELEELVNRLNDIEGDGLILTGDLFHSWLTPVESAVPVLGRLRPRRLGNVAVLGNHDYYAGERRSVDSLNASNFRVLKDEWVSYRCGEAAIHIGGIDDPEGHWGKAFQGFSQFVAKKPKTDGLSILLSHRPGILPLASKYELDFVVAGHLHGGQIILPTLHARRGMSAARLFSTYTHGWYRLKQTRMYLNRGLGLTFLPWRVNCPPEIALFHLKPGAEARVSAVVGGCGRRRPFRA